MHSVLRRACVWAAVCGLATLLVAQTASKPAAKTQTQQTWRNYCHTAYGFCFQYPAAWTVLGEVFDGQGVVVAPPQTEPRELWDSVTAAQVVPSPEGDEEPATIEETISQAVSGVRKTGQSFETLERRQLTVNGNSAELVKMHYTEAGSGREWIEELAFIQGPDSEIYSAALKCAPSSLARMEPQFQHIVQSWKLQEGGDEPAPKVKPAPAKPATPQTTAPPKP